MEPLLQLHNFVDLAMRDALRPDSPGLAQLQARLGVELVKPDHSLTPEGALLLAESQKALSQIVKAEKAVSEGKGHFGETPADRIEHALARGDVEGAYSEFEAAGGWYLYYLLGPDTFSQLLRGFPESDMKVRIQLVLSQVLLAFKDGETAWARHHLGAFFGNRLLDIDHCVSDACDLPLSARTLRLILLIYEDGPISERLLRRLYNFLPQIPADAHLIRGSVYNAMIDFYIRMRRYDQADEAALRALRSYERGQTPLLCFYASLHRAVLRLFSGDISQADKRIKVTRHWLDMAGFDSPGDEILLNLVAAAVAVEQGESGPMLQFLETDLEAFETGDVWPTMAEIAVQNGTSVLFVQHGLRAALSFLDHWGRFKIMNPNFRIMIETRRAQILQNANRWGEAAQGLASLQARFDRVWIASAGEELTRIEERHEIILALTWLRQLVYEHPRQPFLNDRLRLMRRNPRLSSKQRAVLDIWQAFRAKKMRAYSEARQLLLRVFEQAAQEPMLASLAEEDLFLSDLLQDRRMSDFLTAIGPARSVLSKLERYRSAYGRSPAREVLTRQEFKILTFLSEGASNKIIATRLRLSESTVKFHLKNLYRKLGCAKRNEAVQTARSLGWVA